MHQKIYFRPDFEPELKKVFGNSLPVSLKTRASALPAGSMIIEKSHRAIPTVRIMGVYGTAKAPVRLLLLPGTKESQTRVGNILLALQERQIRTYPLPDRAALLRIARNLGSKDAERLVAFMKIENGELMVWDCNLHLYQCPVADIPPLANLDENSLGRFQVSDSGSRVHWDNGDVDLSLDSLRYHSDPAFREKTDEKTLKELGYYGSAIARLRKKHGLKQKDFSPDITEREIRRIEKGEVSHIRYETLQTLAARHRLSVKNYLDALAAAQSARP